MRSVSRVAAEIGEIEGFDVRFVNGADNVSLRRVDEYPFERAARGNWTVAKWREARFWSTYPDCDVEVLKPDGTVAHGKTLLDTLRAAWAGADDDKVDSITLSYTFYPAKPAARQVYEGSPQPRL